MILITIFGYCLVLFVVTMFVIEIIRPRVKEKTKKVLSYVEVVALWSVILIIIGGYVLLLYMIPVEIRKVTVPNYLYYAGISLSLTLFIVGLMISSAILGIGITKMYKYRHQIIITIIILFVTGIVSLIIY
jgi:hypothetical protein